MNALEVHTIKLDAAVQHVQATVRNDCWKVVAGDTILYDLGGGSRHDPTQASARLRLVREPDMIRRYLVAGRVIRCWLGGSTRTMTEYQIAEGGNVTVRRMERTVLTILDLIARLQTTYMDMRQAAFSYRERELVEALFKILESPHVRAAVRRDESLSDRHRVLLDGPRTLSALTKHEDMLSYEIVPALARLGELAAATA